MNTVFARALLALTLVALPASALASTKSEAKPDKASKSEAKPDKAKHSHAHTSVAKKEPKTKKAKHHGHI